LVCFFVVLGLAKLMGIISAVLPFLFLAGAVVLFFIGIRIVKTRIDLDQPRGLEKKHAKFQRMSGFWAGLLLNASNPSIFLGWITSTFLAVSFAASLGLNVGGMDQTMGVSMRALNKVPSHAKVLVVSPKRGSEIGQVQPNRQGTTGVSASLSALSGAGYAVSVGIGTILWFSTFSYFLSRFRTRFPTFALQRTIQGLGVFLCLLAVYFLARAIILIIK
jgi:arginine exporter protein ArgO